MDQTLEARAGDQLIIPDTGISYKERTRMQVVRSAYRTFCEAEADKTDTLSRMTSGLRLRYHLKAADPHMAKDKEEFGLALKMLKDVWAKKKDSFYAGQPEPTREAMNRQSYSWGDPTQVRQAKPLEMLVTGDAHNKRRARNIYDDVTEALSQYMVDKQTAKPGLFSRFVEAIGLQGWEGYVLKATRGLTIADRKEAYRLALEVMPKVEQEASGLDLNVTREEVTRAIQPYKWQHHNQGQLSQYRINMAVEAALPQFLNAESSENRTGLLDRLTAHMRLKNALAKNSIQFSRVDESGQQQYSELTRAEMGEAIGRLTERWNEKKSEFYSRMEAYKDMRTQIAYTPRLEAYTVSA